MNLYQQPQQFQGYDEEEFLEITPEQLEEQRKAREVVIDRADAMKRLVESEDFKKVFETMYFEEEPARLGLLLSSGALSEQSVKGANNDLMAIGKLRHFIDRTIAAGTNAKEEIEALEAERDRALEAAEDTGGEA